jgi:hypothetical protein
MSSDCQLVGMSASGSACDDLHGRYSVAQTRRARFHQRSCHHPILGLAGPSAPDTVPSIRCCRRSWTIVLRRPCGTFVEDVLGSHHSSTRSVGGIRPYDACPITGHPGSVHSVSCSMEPSHEGYTTAAEQFATSTAEDRDTIWIASPRPSGSQTSPIALRPLRGRFRERSGALSMVWWHQQAMSPQT